MFDLRITDLSKTEEEGNIDFIALTNEQWAMIKTNIEMLKKHEKCELMYAEDFKKSIDKARADGSRDFAEWLSNTEYVASQGHFILPLRGCFTIDDVVSEWEKGQENE